MTLLEESKLLENRTWKIWVFLKEFALIEFVYNIIDKFDIIAFEIGTKVPVDCNNLRGVVTNLELFDSQCDNYIKVFQDEFTVANKFVYNPKSKFMVNFNVLSFSTSKVRLIGYPPLAIIQALEVISF